ncbi:hypothetical protein ACJJTC_009540 [Scirpophaga incertulas]
MDWSDCRNRQFGWPYLFARFQEQYQLDACVNIPAAFLVSLARKCGSEGPMFWQEPRETGEKARLARVWGAVDSRILKPLLTHARPPLTDTLPAFMTPLARLLTTTHQYTQGDNNLRRTDSDSDLCIDEPPPVPTNIDPQVR